MVAMAMRDVDVAGSRYGVDTQNYAGFWKRFAAYLIDAVILWTVNSFLYLVVRSTAVTSLAIIIGYLYFAGFESSERQATLGKRALGIYVTDLDGNRISFGRASLRYIGKIVSTLTIFVGYIMVAFTARKQALHDMIANTLVLSR